MPREPDWDDWDRMGVTVVKISGESHHSRDLKHPDFAPGQPVLLMPAPENEFDPDAIKVVSWDGTRQAGWVPRRDTPDVRRAFASGHPVYVMALFEWCRDDNRRTSVKLLVARDGAVDGLPELPEHPPLGTMPAPRVLDPPSTTRRVRSPGRQDS